MKFLSQSYQSGLLRWTLVLMCYGLVILYSASQQVSTVLLWRQSAWMCVGLMACVLVSHIRYQYWLDMSLVLYVGGLLVLGGLLVAGHVSHGASRWLAVGPIRVQPSEMMKIVTALMLARILGNQLASGAPPTWGTVARATAVAAIPAGLVLLQPDLGTASTFGLMLLAMLWVAGTPVRLMGTICGTGLLMLPIGFQFLKAYQRSRLLVFLNPDIDPLGAGYTIIQSRIAIGSGGLWGKGWLAGTQNQLRFLPERHTDFIFAVIGEEWGLLGCLLLLGLFALWLAEAWHVAYRVQEPRGRLMVVGLLSLVGYHVVVNVGMTMGLLPVVGLPLPLVSYGGSAVIMVLVAVGIIDSVRRGGPLV